jgi:hypothetical protein
MADIRRLSLEATGSTGHIFGPDYGVAVIWINEEILHAALMDFGDSDDMGRGMDIAEPTRLLDWLIDDRFLGDWDRFLAYCDSNGIGLVADPHGPPSDRNRLGIPLTWTNDTLYTHHGPWGGTPASYRVADWRGLTLVLLRDRCEGRNSWDRLATLLEDAGIQTSLHWRGYV